MSDTDHEKAPVTCCPPQKRFIFVFLTLLSNIICYADRTNMGIVVLSLPYDEARQGLILSAFFWGYFCTQMIGGYFATQYGGKIVLLLGVLGWTIFDILTVPFYKYFYLLLMARIGMGLGEGMNYPADHVLCAAWSPLPERSRIVTLLSSGQDLGTILSLFLAPQIQHYLGWEYIFVIFGSLSFSWIVLFACFGSSDPTTHSTISIKERRYIVKNRGDFNSGHSVKVPWKQILTTRGTWAIVFTHSFYAYGTNVLLAWLPKFFQDKIGVDLQSKWYFLVIPYVCSFLGFVFGGWFSDFLISHKVPILYVRRLLNTIGMSGAAVAVWFLGSASDPWFATALVSACLFAGRLSMCAFWVNMLDLGPSCAGSLMGVSNMIATSPAIVGNAITGWILQKTNNNWALVFRIAAIIYMAGALVYVLFSQAREMFKTIDVEDGEKTKLIKTPTINEVKKTKKSRFDW